MQKENTLLAKRWQDAKEGEVYKDIWAIVDTLVMQATLRHETWREYERIYGFPYWQASRPNQATGLEHKMRVNRCRLHVETYVSRWMKSRVLPMIVSKGGDYALHQKTKKHNALIEGAFEELGVFDTDPKWCRDAAIYGTAIGYVGDSNGEPVVARCDPFSILIDDLEWREGDGKTIHRVRLRPKDELRAEFPQFDEVITNSTADLFQFLTKNSISESQREVCPVIESWSLSLGDVKAGGFKGRHTITISGADLFDEEYTEKTLPFTFLTRTAPQEGIWGEPLMADLAPVQETLDRYLKRIDESMWLTNVVRLLVKKGGHINAQKLTNVPATLLEVENMDDIKSFNAEISPQLMQFVQFSLNTMQELGRSNIMSTTGDMPKNIRAYSAMKLLEETDMEGLREGLRSRDAFFVQIGKKLIRVFERLGGYKLLVRNGKHAEVMNYKKIRLPENSYTWTVMPTNFLAKTAEGRMDQAEWLVDQGLLPKDRVAHFIDFPDLESETAMSQAQYDAIAFRIAKALEEGIYIAPHAFLQLSLVRKMVGNAIARAEADGAPDDKIELLRQLVLDAALLQSATAAPPPGSAATAAPSGGAAPSPEAAAPIGAMQPPVPPELAMPAPAAMQPQMPGIIPPPV